MHRVSPLIFSESGTSQLEGVSSFEERIIPTQGGRVLHAIKKNSDGFDGFAEAYFSDPGQGVLRGWKKHHEMTLNIVVPVGKISFWLAEDLEGTPDLRQIYFTEIDGKIRNVRMTVKPGVWMAFRGAIGRDSMLLNFANIIHRPDEVESQAISEVAANDILVQTRTILEIE